MAHDVTSPSTNTSGLYTPSTLNLAMVQPEVYPNIIKQYSSQGRGDHLINDLMLFGQEIGIASEKMTTFGEGWYHENFEVSSAGASSVSGTGTQTIPIETADDAQMFPKPGDIVMYPDGNQSTGIIQGVDISSSEITVASSSSGLPGVSDGDILVISNNAWGEGTGQPKSRAKQYDQIEHQLQVIKGTLTMTGTLLTQGSWVNVSEYGTGFDFWNTAIADLDAEMDMLESNALMFNNGQTYSATSNMVTAGLAENQNDPIRETKGLIKHAKESGDEVAVTTAGVDYTDLENIDNYLRGQGDTSPYIMGNCGHLMARSLSRAIGENIANPGGGVDPTDTVSNILQETGVDEETAKARAAQMKYLQYADTSRTYLWKTSNELSNPKTFGSAGQDLDKSAVFYPLNTVSDEFGTQVPSVAVLHKEENGYNRRREFWQSGAAGGDSARYVGDKDKNNHYERSHIGLMCGAPNQITFWNPNA